MDKWMNKWMDKWKSRWLGMGMLYALNVDTCAMQGVYSMAMLGLAC